jgi:hypothetical protein
MTHWRDPSEDLDNQRPSPAFGLSQFMDAPIFLLPAWRYPLNADEVIACNKIDNDLQRVVLAHELNRLEKRNGF